MDKFPPQKYHKSINSNEMKEKKILILWKRKYTNKKDIAKEEDAFCLHRNPGNSMVVKDIRYLSYEHKVGIENECYKRKLYKYKEGKTFHRIAINTTRIGLYFLTY